MNEPLAVTQFPTIKREDAQRFLRTLDDQTERFTFQLFDDNEKRKDSSLARVLHGTLAERYVTLVDYSRRGAGVFVTVNQTNFRGRTKECIVAVRSYFADLDGAPLKNILRLSLMPNVITQTSLGRHGVFYNIADAPVDAENFKRTQLSLAELFDGDPTVCDLPRVMRLPGFPHQKNPQEPFITEIDYRTSQRAIEGKTPLYTDTEFQQALAKALAALEPRRSITAASLGGLPKPPPDWSEGYKEGQRNIECARRAGSCFARGMREEETVKDCLRWDAEHNDPPLGEVEVRRAVASIGKTHRRNNPATTTQDANSSIVSTATHGQPSQREKLISIGLDADLWHDLDGNTFATVKVDQHEESFAIKSSAFCHWLTREYGEQNPIRVHGKTCPSAPSAQTLKEAISALAAKAARGVERQAALRVAEHGGLIYLDLGTREWGAIEVSATGWRIITNPPVRFIRPAGFRPLPVPVKGGSILELRKFLNAGSDADFVLIVCWLIAALHPTGPYPVLVINGEQGSGKSISCRVLRRLIDPNGAELRSDTRDERDLLLAAKNGWIVALDNLSYVRNDLSDAICRIATKGAFATRRTLYR